MSDYGSDIEYDDENSSDGWEDFPHEPMRRISNRRRVQTNLKSTHTMARKVAKQQHHRRTIPAPETFKRYLRERANEVIIMDNIETPLYVRIAAGLGPKFVYPTKPKMGPCDTIGAITAIQQITSCILDDEQRSAISAQLQQRLRDFFRHMNKKPVIRMCNTIARDLTAIFQRTQRFLGVNKHIMISEADKGKKSIICLKMTIEQKRNEMLKDAVADGTYTKVVPLEGESADQQLIRIHNTAELEYKSVAQSLRRHIVGGVTACTEGDIMRGADQSRRTPSGQKYERRLDNGKVHLLGDKHLSAVQPKRIRNEAYSLARMYISIKVHKGETYPARPIIAAPAVMGSSMEEWIKEMLTVLINPGAAKGSNGVDAEYINNYGFIANNTFGVIENIKRNGLKPGHCIISFDIVSMYTNVNTSSALDIIEEKYLAISKHTTVPASVFIKSLKCLMQHNSLFTANNGIYRQTKGLPMGGKLSKILSEIVTACGTAAALREAMAVGFVFSFVHKYVDDYIIGVNLNNGTRTIERLQEIFEANLKGMKLTHEVEKWTDDMAEIKYLDFTIMRKGGVQGISTIWSRPKFASERMVSAYADVPHNSKINTINEIINKAINYSTGEMKLLALHRAEKWICSNGYTAKAFNSILESNTAYKKMRAAECNSTITVTKREMGENEDGERVMLLVNEGGRVNTQRRLKCAVCQGLVRTRKRTFGQSVFTCTDCEKAIAQVARQADVFVNEEQAADTIDDTSNEGAIAVYERSIRIDRGLDGPASKQMRTSGGGMREMRPVNEALEVVTTDYTPLYIKIPHVKGLDSTLNGILRSWRLKTRFASGKGDNGIFKNVKDKVDMKFSSMATFSIWCSTCNAHQILNATDTTIQNRIANHRRNHDSAHDLRWREPHIIATHPTVARAFLGHTFIKNINSREGVSGRDDIILWQVQQLFDTPYTE